MMFLHHVLQCPSGEVVERRGSLGRLSGINRIILRVLVFMPIGWSSLNAMRTFDREPTLQERAIDSLQHFFAWATLALFLVGTALSLVVTVVRVRSSMSADGINARSGNRG